MMSTVNTEFSSFEVWFAEQASKALEIEENVNLTLIIGYTHYKIFPPFRRNSWKNYWKMAGTNETSGILLKFCWNSSSSNINSP